MSNARIIGIGHPMAGDDAAGLAAIAAIRRIGTPSEIELAEVVEPSRMIAMLSDGADPIILIDAVIDGGRPGRIIRIDSRTRAPRVARLLSTHGVGVLEAIELARTLHPETAARRIEILAITISARHRKGESLSPPVAKALPRAARKAIALASGA